ncbi:MAG: 5'/3'-nucleotidase SurE [Alphaproteobacteria bacterium]|nr:5'/3'-nucleotidase SurE [Alphaproteobacteria bacterium]
MATPSRILLTNDDGIDATGLEVLEACVRSIVPDADLWIIAPESEQSGTAQSVTMHNPLRLRTLNERRFTVSGTPSDCMVLGLQHLMRDARPDLVLSGVNAGMNAGYDVNLSGTLGAAFTGLMYGIPSMGISLKRLTRQNTPWPTAHYVLPPLLSFFLEKGWPERQCLSVNIPAVPPEEIKGWRVTTPSTGRRPPFAIKQGVDLRDRDYFWVYPQHHDFHTPGEGTDIDALLQNYVSITPLSLMRETDGASCPLPPPLPKSR